MDLSTRFSQGEFCLVLGKDVSKHSKSPLLWNQVFQAMGSSCRYHALDVGSEEELKLVLAQLPKMPGFRGGNITIPWKEAVFSLLTYCDPVAEQIRSVNTIAPTPAGLIGSNTDGGGFLKALEEVSLMFPQRALVLGGGGAARAVIWALKNGGAEVSVAIRDLSKVDAISNDFPGIEILPLSSHALDPSPFDLFVNATPSGNPCPPEWIEKSAVHALFFDLSYGASAGEWLGKAKALQRRTLNGSTMLVHQAALSFVSLFGGKIDEIRNRMKSALPT